MPRIHVGDGRLHRLHVCNQCARLGDHWHSVANHQLNAKHMFKYVLEYDLMSLLDICVFLTDQSWYK